jgi:hypothetical protein
LEARVTHEAIRSFWAVTNATRNVLRQPDGSGEASAYAFVREAGVTWWSDFTLEDPAFTAPRFRRSYVRRNHGHPLPGSETLAFADVLSMPDGLTENGDVLGWTGEGDAGVDRVQVRIEGTEGNWILWAPAGTTEVNLPRHNPDVAPHDPGQSTRVTVEIQDRADIAGYADALSSWGVDDGLFGKGHSVEFRMSQIIDDP